MTTNDIRSKFLNFFKSKEHSIIASDSLVPKDDPTVLFTTAGMQQFKPQFMGHLTGFNKASTCQKCLRTDDLDCVGQTDFHHTFFEMLGNFSFGDYFKTQAIHWAWEFLTVQMQLPKEKLWVSVYKEDEEAYLIWRNDIQMPVDRIVKLGDKSNFWPSNARLNGPNGPCGPCSEIFYDYGVNPNCPNGAKCDPDCSCGRFSEVWNLVFTQFNRKDGGILEPLPAKNIDTGMGLERLAAVVQGVKSNYDTDNFKTILDVVKKTLSKLNITLTVSEQRIIADHMRAVVIGICDGVIPSNEGRGYVMRKLIVNMTDIITRQGNKSPVIYNFVDVVVNVLSQPYPELVTKAAEIKEMIKRIEESYLKVLQERVPELKEKMAAAKNDAKKLGDLLFLYSGTYGVSASTMMIIAKEVSISEDILKQAKVLSDAQMEKERERSRASSKMTGDVFTEAGISLDVPKTEFVGYDVLEADAKVLKVLNEGNQIKVILNRTPFYAASGGQVGDVGTLRTANAVVRVTDTQKINDIYVHEGVIEKGVLNEGDAVQTQVDRERRLAITRNHTATHLLQSAMREILGTHVKQQGSLVDPNRLRFDFAHHKGVTPQEIEQIENRLVQFIKSDDKVVKEVLPIEEAKKKGALAFFAEKYGDVVRVITIGNYSTEFCGGTHVNKTSDIAAVKIVSEGSVAQGIRRIEAVTGVKAVEDFLKQRQEAEKEKQEVLRLKQIEKQEQDKRFEDVKASLDQIMAKATVVNNVHVISYVLNGGDMVMLRKLSDLLKQKAATTALVLGVKNEADASLIVSLSDNLTATLKANDIINQVAPMIQGSGGGRPNMAQAGGKSPEKLEAAVEQAKTLIKELLSK